MTTHILSLTYAPKIPLVKSGECTQTIRLHNPDRPKKVGDKLILHTWAGKPYRTKWDWRLETEISDLRLLKFPDVSKFSDTEFVRLWSYLGNLARLDGINPPDAETLMRTLGTLNNLNGLLEGTIWDIIRWPKPTIGGVT